MKSNVLQILNAKYFNALFQTSNHQRIRKSVKSMSIKNYEFQYEVESFFLTRKTKEV